MKIIKHLALTSIIIGTLVEQINAQNTFTQLDIVIPIEYKTTAFYISGNGLNAIGSFEVEKTSKIIFFTRNENSFNNPQEITFEESFKSPCTPCLNHDASRIYFSAKNENNNFDIYYCDKINDTWSTPTPLDQNINSDENEMWPSISSDGLSLYFVRVSNDNINKKNYCGNIFLSDRTPNDSWNEATQLTESITFGNDLSPYIAQDNKTLYFSSLREGGMGECDIYYAYRETEFCWILPINISDINTATDNKLPFFDPLKSEIIFLNQDLKKKDKYTLVSAKTEAKYLPKETCRFFGNITNQNTNQPLEANIIVSDAFSSSIIAIFKNDKQTGKYDFVLPKNGNSVILDYYNTGYSHTILDKEVNNNEENINVNLYNNIELTLNAFDKAMLEPIDANIEIFVDNNIVNTKIEKIASGRDKLTLPIGKKYKISISHDLYENYQIDLDLSKKVQFKDFERDIELNSQKEKVTFKIAGINKAIDIEIVNLSTKEKRTTTITTDEKGNATAYLRKGDKYEVNIMPKGYSFYNGSLDLSQKQTQFVVTTTLEPLKEDVKMELQNITFETNSADFNASSNEELERLVDLLKLNIEFKVEISAHTDDKGADAYNLKLSERRAIAVANYLKAKGILANRLVTKGYGKTKPLVPNTNDENRAINRRVEFKIIGIEKNN